MGSMVKAQAAASPAPTVKKVTLYVGYENYSIKIKDLRKGSKVTYTSSNKKIATVTSKGVISPVAAGNATITVSVAQSGKIYKSTIVVTVKKSICIYYQ
jgi:hypothetical protein